MRKKGLVPLLTVNKRNIEMKNKETPLVTRSFELE